MISKTLSCLLLLSQLTASAQALSITSPSAGTTTLQANSDFTLRWSINSTDPPAFDIIVATGHDINTPDKNVSVASNVPTSQLSFPISWHNLAITAGSFCQIALINTTTDGLYAYSDGFRLVQGGPSGSSGTATGSSTTSRTVPTQPTTTNLYGPYTPYVYSTKSIAELAESEPSNVPSYGCPEGFAHAAGTESTSSGCWKTQLPPTTFPGPHSTTSLSSGLWQDWSSVAATMFPHSTTASLPTPNPTPPGSLSSPAGPIWAWSTPTPSTKTVTSCISPTPNGIIPAPFPPLDTVNMTLNSTPARSTSFAPPVLSMTNSGSPYSIGSTKPSMTTGAVSATSASDTSVRSTETTVSSSATATAAASASASISSLSSSAAATAAVTSDTGRLEFVTWVFCAMVGVEAMAFFLLIG